MIAGIRCADGMVCTVEECSAGCRMGSRCAPLAYLDMVTAERKWTGAPSVTQLIKGTREAYLMIKTGYIEDPQDAAFRVLGTRGHGLLEGHASKKSFTEERLELDGIHGTFDALEFEGSEIRLIDTKTSGAFKVARALGIQKQTHNIPVMDDAGKPVVFKSGPRKGMAKTRKEYTFSTGPADMRDWELQLNFYRCMVAEIPYQVTHQRIFAVVRDGGTHVAKSYGIDRKIYMIDVPFLPDAEVRQYFAEKRQLLLDAMATDKMPMVCDPSECWEGRKCRGFCKVAEVCRVAGCPYLSEDPANDVDPDQEGEAA
jgi:hypothetical protein